MTGENKEIYCSLDIETSGFDPEVNEILEVGFAFFEISNKRLEIKEEWTQVFKPSREVSPQILGLTGIKQAELDNAPAFSEFRDQIQEKLGSATIVGHNVGFDIKFLEAFGIKFTGKVIDTLDLVQFILPTHHSYNLENLMHYFKISHKEAHRALPDAKACISLLESLLGVYQIFSKKLKDEIQNLIIGHKLPWQDLFDSEIHPVKINKSIKASSLKTDLNFKLKPNTIYDLPLANGEILGITQSLQKQKNKIFLVLSKVWQVLSLWEQGLVEPILPVYLLFSEEKFNAAINSEDLTAEQIKFLLKVLVWKHTNWQSKTILDLNCSFFGGQFKDLVIQNEQEEDPVKTSGKLVCTDQLTFLELSKSKKYTDRFLCIVGLNEFENTASFNIGIRVSWGQIMFALKSIYNPELNLGQEQHKTLVTEMLSATDLFFGLANALLKVETESFSYYKIDQSALLSEKYNKIKMASENYVLKLKDAGEKASSEILKKSAQNLEQFFEDEENRVKWIELAESRCAFFSSPIDISKIVGQILAPYKKRAFFDSLNMPELIEYFSARLGIKDFKSVEVKKQKDLFSFKSVFAQNKSECILIPQNLTEEKILEILDQKALPAAILFSSQLTAKTFYNRNYQKLDEKASVFLQNSSGGVNKIFRNFKISQESVLIATDKFVLKYLSNSAAAIDSVEHLQVKTLIINRLPFEQYKHPYQEAVSANFKEPFMDFSLPKALYNFHLLLKFFNTPDLRKVYICDPKINKDYAEIFKKYLEKIPDLKILYK